MDDLLKGITSSLEATKTLVDGIETGLDEQQNPPLVDELLHKAKLDTVEGVSLLSLKNSSLLSYVNNLVLVLLGHLNRLEHQDEEALDKVVKNSIVQRVAMEKGVKPLERKLTYQFDQMVRSYNRMQAESEKKESDVKEKHSKTANSSTPSDSDSSSDDDDELAHRPDSDAIAQLHGTKKKSRDHQDSKEKYRPPKISAAAPPRTTFDDTFRANKPERKLQSMEEYLREQSDMPHADVSIGSAIVNKGRGGEKTAMDRQKEKEIQEYEENNFTRLPQTQTKKSIKQRNREMANTFGGEDFSMFSNNRDVRSGTSRKRKSTTAWDRAKKKRDL